MLVSNVSVFLWSYPQRRYKTFVSVNINLCCADSVLLYGLRVWYSIKIK